MKRHPIESIDSWEAYQLRRNDGGEIKRQLKQKHRWLLRIDNEYFKSKMKNLYDNPGELVTVYCNFLSQKKLMEIL